MEELGSTLHRLVDGEKPSGLNVRRVLKGDNRGENRGSAGTTASGSSGYYESSAASARYSSTSTLPSSVDADRDDDLFSTRSKRPHGPHVASEPPESSHPHTKSFTARAARAFSIGNRLTMIGGGNKQEPATVTPVEIPPVPAILQSDESPSRRARAMTESSYASTAKPEPLNLTTGDFGAEFGSLFDGVGKQTSPSPTRLQHPNVGSQTPASLSRQDSQPLFPPPTASRASNTAVAYHVA